jgi:hypothetical protein
MLTSCSDRMMSMCVAGDVDEDVLEITERLLLLQRYSVTSLVRSSSSATIALRA